MPKCKIIEETTTQDMRRVVTVGTDRGEEFRIDADKAALAVAELISDRANEARQGWFLDTGWFEAELMNLRARCFEKSQSS